MFEKIQRIAFLHISKKCNGVILSTNQIKILPRVHSTRSYLVPLGWYPFDLHHQQKVEGRHIFPVIVTRLHSSRMRTARVLTISPSMLCAGGCTWSRGVCSLGGVCSEGGCTWSWGVSAPRGVSSPRGVPGPGVSAPRGVCSWGGVPGPGGCLLPGGCLALGGVPSLEGCLVLGVCVCLLWGVCSRGVSAPGGVPGAGGCQVLPPVNRMTNRCKNITLPQTSFGG